MSYVLESQGLWWHKVRGQSMHQGTCCSSKDKQTSPQSPSDSSIQLWLFDMFYFSSPLIAWKALGTWSSFSSLMQQIWILGHCKAPWFVPCMVWYAVTLQMCQLLRSLGCKTEANIWMVVVKTSTKKQHIKSPLSTYHHFIAERGLLCSCFTPVKAGLCFLTSLPDGSLRRTCSSWQCNKWHQLRSGLKSHLLLPLR